MVNDSLPTAAKALRDQILGLRDDLARLRRKCLTLFAGALLLVTSCVTIALYSFYPHASAIFPLAITLPLLLSLAMIRAANLYYRRECRRHLIETLTYTSGFAYNPLGYFSPHAYAYHGILPPGKEAASTEGFEGNYNNVSLALQTAEIKRGGTILMAVIRLKKPLDGHTVVMTSNAARVWFQDKFDNYGKISAASGRYDKQVETFTTERTEARLLLDSHFMDRFMEAGALLGARWVAASFYKAEILMVLDLTRPFLIAPPLWEPVRTEVLLPVYERFDIFFKIVDVFRANHQTQT